MSDTFQVYANPFCSLDGYGNPNGTVARDPRVDKVGGYVGATIASVEITKKYPKGDLRSSRQKTLLVFSSDPVTLPATGYYRKAIQNGSLIAADLATAKQCAVPFLPIAEALSKAKDLAIEHYRAREGKEPACASQSSTQAA